MFSKVGEIFLAAGNAYSKLGDAVMTLYNCQDEGKISNPYNKVNSILTEILCSNGTCPIF